jgi:hypothetical protein
VSASYVVGVVQAHPEAMDQLRAERLNRALVTEGVILERIQEVVDTAKPSELPGLALAVKATIDSAGGSAPQRIVVSMQEGEEVGLARIGFGSSNIATVSGRVIDIDAIPSASGQDLAL